MLVSVTEADVEGKTVLLRVDYNVPLENGEIKDDTRIQGSLPTINYLLDKNARLVLCSHLGRPKGKVVPELSLKPIASYLGELLGQNIEFVDNLGSEEMRQKVKNSTSKLLLLENTRFDPGEEKNSTDFSEYLASLANIYVSDAFGAVHRAHASTEGVTKFIPGYAGMLVEKEFKRITTAMNNPSKPALAIFGGAKISTKLEVLENFVGKADTIVLGGGMANTFLKAQGKEVGNSLVEEEMLDTAKEIMNKVETAGMKLVIPIDVRLSKTFDEPWIEDSQAKVTDSEAIPSDGMILDIGPKTESMIIDEINKSNTITWNGPMGVFEKELYRSGTLSIASAVVSKNIQTVVGGGETAYAFNMLDKDIPDHIHISTGGGASLELMSGADLPGLTCLTGKVNN